MKIYSSKHEFIITIEPHDTPNSCAWLIDNMRFSKIFQKNGKFIYVAETSKQGEHQ